MTQSLGGCAVLRIQTTGTIGCDDARTVVVSRRVCQANPRGIGLAYLVVGKARAEYGIDDKVSAVEQAGKLLI